LEFLLEILKRNEKRSLKLSGMIDAIPRDVYIDLLRLPHILTKREIHYALKHNTCTTWWSEAKLSINESRRGNVPQLSEQEKEQEEARMMARIVRFMV